MKINVKRFRGLTPGYSHKTVYKFLNLPMIYRGYLIWFEFVKIDYDFVWKDRLLFGGNRKVWIVSELTII